MRGVRGVIHNAGGLTDTAFVLRCVSGSVVSEAMMISAGEHAPTAEGGEDDG